MDEAFWTVHADLPRQGPGEAADVAWALDVAATPEEARILDAGCGPGADLLTLTEMRPGARVTGIEAHAPFAEAARARLGGRAEVRTGDMAAPGGDWDLIWCAGALYFLGIEAGLAGWRDALAQGGAVAFTEPFLAADAKPGSAAFWAGYEATDEDGIAARVRGAGWRLEASRRIGSAAWDAYYGPLEARIAALRPEADAELTEALDAEAREIALWRADLGGIGYAQFVVRPS